MILLEITFIGILVELILQLMVKHHRKHFPWLITADDELPNLASNEISKFKNRSYDPTLGWVTKPNIQGNESIGSIGAKSGHNSRVSFSIDSIGARTNSSHSNLPALISAYGDSYTFCRQVEDDNTWPWYLSEYTQSNVLNFGVGGYGVDQALLRLKREYKVNPTKIVILQFVPETISRILSVWRHYYEFGNIFAFKPRFIERTDDLTVVSNPILSPSSFQQLPEFIRTIQKNDYFYKKKFCKYIYRTPYIWTFFRKPVRQGKLLIQLNLRSACSYFGQSYDGAWGTILKENQDIVLNLYKDKSATSLLNRIVREFREYGKQEGFISVVVFLPYEDDLRRYRATGNKFYGPILSDIEKDGITLDAADILIKHLDSGIYTNRYYGSHLTGEGNKIVARYIFEKLEEAGILKIN